MTTHEQPTMTDQPNEPSDTREEWRNDDGVAVTPEAAPADESPAPPAESPRAEAPAAEPAVPQHDSSTDDVADLTELRARWAGVQAAFVDDPKDCVQQADLLVADLFEQLTKGFAATRSRLEEQWSRGEEASTEDLRLVLMRYREFFERLLAA
jgi:predicted lipid-binding transport protein (Tim44 family)